MRRSTAWAFFLLLPALATALPLSPRSAPALSPQNSTASPADSTKPQDTTATPKPAATPVVIPVFAGSLPTDSVPKPVPVNLHTEPPDPTENQPLQNSIDSETPPDTPAETAPPAPVPSPRHASARSTKKPAAAQRTSPPVENTASPEAAPAAPSASQPAASAQDQAAQPSSSAAETSIGAPTPSRRNVPAPVYPKKKTAPAHAEKPAAAPPVVAPEISPTATAPAASAPPAEAPVVVKEQPDSAPAAAPAVESPVVAVPAAAQPPETVAPPPTPAATTVQTTMPPAATPTPEPAPAQREIAPPVTTPAVATPAPEPAASAPPSTPAAAAAVETTTAPATVPTVPIVMDLGPSPSFFGYADFSGHKKWDDLFLAVPNATLAGEELQKLTSEPHWASSPEDYRTALYVASKFKDAGLQTQIVPFRVYLNKPVKIQIDAFDSAGRKLMSGPTPEHVDPKAYGGDPSQDDPRILPAFNGSSPSGDVTAQVVYANYGTVEDFKLLDKLGISVKGKIVIMRYGQIFRGVKVELAQQRGAAGVLIYSDPADDGYVRGDVYPRGPYRPATSVQRGSVQFLPIYPGDPETPGIASTPDLPDSSRITDREKMNQPFIPSNPLSYQDATPILKGLDGPESPRDWQGGLPFTYHLGGTDSLTVRMNLVQDYQLRTIWDVIGIIPGWDTRAWVVAGNHRDAWVFGAVDPNSGTAAMLEAVHGLGELTKLGWKPRRTIVIGSWDAEEEGLIGSTEWAELHAADLAHAVAYFNTDVGVAGPDFTASSVPSLEQFIREITREVPSPKGGSVYDQWLKAQQSGEGGRSGAPHEHEPLTDPRIGNLGSGSDYSAFIQHLGVPSTDIGSDGPYGVYHSAFDDYNWFIKFADPNLLYEQQQARIFGLELLHMADSDVLPYDDQLYGQQIIGYLKDAQGRATAAGMKVDFSAANTAAQRFASAGEAVHKLQLNPPSGVALAGLNFALRDAESALLNSAGLPNRAWYRHTIYAPGEFTGYAAVVIPGVNEGIDAADSARTQAQLDALTKALNRSAEILEGAGK